MRKTVTTFCILTPLLWKNVVTELRCSVTTVYRASCCGTLVWKCSISSDELANQLVKICLRSVLTMVLLKCQHSLRKLNIWKDVHKHY